MGELHILNKREQKEVYGRLKDQFGFEAKLGKVMLKSQKDKIYLCTDAVFELDLNSLRIDTIGLYFGRLVPKGFRLSIEGSQIIGPKSKKNVLSLDKQQMKDWMAGLDAKVDEKPSGYYLLEFEKTFVGCGYIKDNAILNYVPKNRRLT